MHFIISAITRITLATLMLLGVCLLVPLALLSFILELLADERSQPPLLADDDSRLPDSLLPQVSGGPKATTAQPSNGGAHQAAATRAEYWILRRAPQSRSLIDRGRSSSPWCC